MRGFNHVVGGFAFAGIFASFADVNLFAKPEYIATVAATSLLADIDHTKSPAGKLFWPVARFLDRKYGHRTVTHSLLFYLAFVALFGVFEMLLSGQKTLTMFAALGYGSHLLFDMCTRQGIPLFLPFTSSRCVLPGNPNLRLSGRNFVSETLVCFGFVALLLTTMPLMANGFWTSYNQAFKTLAHLEREQRRSKDLLFVKTVSGVSGHVVSANTSGAVLFTGQEFKTLPATAELAEMRHTGQPGKVVRIEFEEISTDSLRAILRFPLVSLKTTAKRPVSYKWNNSVFETKGIELKHATKFHFLEVEPDQTETLAKIARLEETIKSSAQMIQVFKKEQAAKAVKLAQLQTGFAAMSEYEQGKAIEEIARLKNDLETAKQPENTESARLAAVEIQTLRASLNVEPNSFTGVAEIWKQ